MEVYKVIVLMMLVTYIPRLLPMYFFNTEKISSSMRRFLAYIPYAALGALILPGGIQAINGKPELSAISILIAAVIAWFNSNIIVTVLLTVLITWLFLFTGI